MLKKQVLGIHKSDVCFKFLMETVKNSPPPPPPPPHTHTHTLPNDVFVLVSSNSSHWLKRKYAYTLFTELNFFYKRAISPRQLAPSPYFFLILVHLIDINVSAEIDEYPSLHFQDIREKQRCGRTQKNYKGQ